MRNQHILTHLRFPIIVMTLIPLNMVEIKSSLPVVINKVVVMSFGGSMKRLLSILVLFLALWFVII